MATLIVGDGLKDLIKKKIIENGSEKCVEGMKYDFRLGDRFLKAKHQVAAHISDFSVASKENFAIEPGETVFVVSEEILHLPANMKAEISHKRKLAHNGILVLGGFCVDPLYEGYLIFGMYNYSSRVFHLKREAKLIAAQFYILSEDEMIDFPKPKPLMDFPDDLIQIAKSLQPVSLSGINEKISALANRLSGIERNFKDQENWFEKTRSEIDRLVKVTNDLSANTTRLGEKLEAETKLRETGQDSLGKLIEKEQTISDRLSRSITTESIIRKIAIWIIAIIIAAAIGFGIVNWAKTSSMLNSDQTNHLTHTKGQP